MAGRPTDEQVMLHALLANVADHQKLLAALTETVIATNAALKELSPKFAEILPRHLEAAAHDPNVLSFREQIQRTVAALETVRQQFGIKTE